MRKIIKKIAVFCLLFMLTAIPVMSVPQLRAEAASTKSAALKKPSSLRLTQYLNRGFVIKWSKVKNADGYEIYIRTFSGKNYVKIGETKECSFQYRKLKKVNSKYVVAVRAYKNEKAGKKTVKTVGEFSTLEITSYKIDIEEIHGRYIDTTFTRDTTVTVLETGKKKKVKAGTRVTAIKRTGNTNTLIMADGLKVSAPRSNLYFGNLVTNNAYYTTAQKELFVNSKGYSSPTDYLIWINQYTLNTTIFKGSKGNWKVVRSMPCVVGRYGKTTTGVLRIKYKVTNLYGSYGLYFTGSIGYGNAFHRLMDGNTRGALSGGCVRLASSDLYFMYMNCPVGTTVLSY